MAHSHPPPFPLAIAQPVDEVHGPAVHSGDRASLYESVIFIERPLHACLRAPSALGVVYLAVPIRVVHEKIRKPPAVIADAKLDRLKPPVGNLASFLE